MVLKYHSMDMKSLPNEEAVREVFGRPLRIKLTTGDAAAGPAPGRN
jgi:hypothetical protein